MPQMQQVRRTRTRIGTVQRSCGMNFPKPDKVYADLAENPKAPIKVRVRALESMQRPSLSLLYRLIHNPNTPAKLYAVAANKYETAILRKELREHARREKKETVTSNHR